MVYCYKLTFLLILNNEHAPLIHLDDGKSFILEAVDDFHKHHDSANLLKRAIRELELLLRLYFLFKSIFFHCINGSSFIFHEFHYFHFFGFLIYFLMIKDQIAIMRQILLK